MSRPDRSLRLPTACNACGRLFVSNFRQKQPELAAGAPAAPYPVNQGGHAVVRRLAARWSRRNMERSFS